MPEIRVVFAVFLCVLGMWDPPTVISEEVPMSIPISADDLLIEKLLTHLKAEGYSLGIQRWYPARVRQLAGLLQQQSPGDRGYPLGAHNAVLAPAISALPETAQRVAAISEWRHPYTGAINMLLRLVHGAWPVPDPPVPRSKSFTAISCTDYDRGLRDLRGLHPETRSQAHEACAAVPELHSERVQTREPCGPERSLTSMRT